MFKILGKMHEVFICDLHYKWLVVVGDAKILQAIRHEYGSHMKWLIPFPGDWHILFNYQKVLMKVYADAGLVQLGSLSGHRAETLTSIIQCSNFRRTHNFLLQAFEAMFRFFCYTVSQRCLFLVTSVTLKRCFISLLRTFPQQVLMMNLIPSGQRSPMYSQVNCPIYFQVF